MSKVHAFGDSFTFGHELSDCPTNVETNYSNLTYAALTATELNKEYCCYAVGAYANNAITRRLIENINDIDSEDLVLIMWTFPHRREFLLDGELGFRSVNTNGNHEFDKNYFKFIDTNPQWHLRETLKEIYIAQTLLKEKNIKHIFLSATTDISQALKSVYASNENLLPYINLTNWLFFEDDLGFVDWAKQVLKLNFGNQHPPDYAHKVLCEKILDKINE
jgi:hypothetical protein